MRIKLVIASILAVLASLSASIGAPAQAGGPYQGNQFQGRIAYSCDGNHNDPDDWASSAVALAILAEAGLRDRLVHFDYNCTLPKTDPEWEKIHAQSVLGAMERYGFDKSRFHDCRRDLDGAVASIARAINDSSADNPLYFILAGPMEVPYRGIQKSDPAKRKFVYCISHSSWNDGSSTRYQYTHTKRSVIEQDVHWVQVRGKPARLDYVELNATAAAGAAGLKPAPGLLRVAVVQMALRPTLAANRDRIVAGIALAADREARVAVFPERALTGSGSERQDLVDEAVDTIRRAARARRINVVFGAHTWLPSVKTNANWMLALNPDGRDLLRYEKLYNNHRATMPGVFAVDGVPCGTAICADRWLRGVVELPIQQGAQVHFELSNNYACEWVAPYEWYWNAPMALRNTVWSVVANSANQVSGVAASPDHLKHGHSAIIAPDGRVVAAARGDTEDLVIADIEPAAATRAGAKARAAHPALRPFWEAGLKLHRGETLGASSFQPLKSAATEITLAAAPAAGDLPRMEALIREARARKADLVAFPAQAIAANALDQLRAAARANQITVVFGTKYRDAVGWHSSAFVIGPDGAVLTRYDQLSATAPFERGTDARAMWFRVKGVPAVVTIGRDALWTELAELAAVVGAQLHIHLDHEADDSPAARQRRLQTWANCASFLTFTATVGSLEAMLWDDLRGRDEIRAAVKGTPKPDLGVVEVDSPFSANLVARAARGGLVVATRRVSASNPHHPHRTSNFNPQMKPWYELGAQLISPR